MIFTLISHGQRDAAIVGSLYGRKCERSVAHSLHSHSGPLDGDELRPEPRQGSTRRFTRLDRMRDRAFNNVHSGGTCLDCVRRIRRCSSCGDGMTTLRNRCGHSVAARWPNAYSQLAIRYSPLAILNNLSPLLTSHANLAACKLFFSHTRAHHYRISSHAKG